MPTYTPAMQQYIDIKRNHTDCILFFRIWDFYETFFEDAKITSKLLDLVLTSKNKNSENPIPMAGIPHHSVDKYIQKLILHWQKIAIAEQTTKPIPWQIVEREVVSIITPWTYIQENEKNFSYMSAITKESYKNWDTYHLARWDFSIWEYRTKSFKNIEEMQKFLSIISPKEIIFDINLEQKDEISIPLQNYIKCLISIYDIPVDPSRYITQNCWIQSISSYGKALEWWRLNAFALLLHYIKNTQKTNISNISKIWLHSQNKKVLLDNITIKNLEIFASSYEWLEKYSLIWILDITKTRWWSRLLRYLLANPSNDTKELNKRLNFIEWYINNFEKTKSIHHNLNKVLDIPKIISNILYKKTSPYQFTKLRSTLSLFYKENQPTWENILLTELKQIWLWDETSKKIKQLYNHLSSLLKEDEDINEEIWFIADKYNPKIDELRQIAYHSDQLLLDYQKELIKISKINNIKIKFIKNQWYFIEITNKDIDLFEKNISNSNTINDWPIIRRNTLKGAQRYTSKYLDTIEQKIFSAKEQLIQHEFALLEQTKQQITQISKELHEFAQDISRLDIFTSQAILAKEKHFTKPIFTKDNSTIQIIWWRHPVIEKFLPIDQQFIPNDLQIWKYKNKDSTSIQEKNTLIITWPNMWWKSTYQKIQLSPIDWLFARVWSWDVIAKNQSTFMTEMIEVANILNNASKDSFVIFDELGRGTSTYDGMALTKAILEHITTKTKCKTIIATHYHEITNLEEQYDEVKNLSVSVYETNKEVIFMKKIVQGPASKSYWLDVAKLAWISQEIINKAQENLEELEVQRHTKYWPNSKFLFPNKINHSSQTNKWTNNMQANYKKIESLIKSYDLDNMTPLQALLLLDKIKDELK